MSGNDPARCGVTFTDGQGLDARADVVSLRVLGTHDGLLGVCAGRRSSGIIQGASRDINNHDKTMRAMFPMCQE